jgi:hypothetical protein
MNRRINIFTTYYNCELFPPIAIVVDTMRFQRVQFHQVEFQELENKLFKSDLVENYFSKAQPW